MSSLTPLSPTSTPSLKNRGPAIDYSKFVWDQEKGGYPCQLCGAVFKTRINVSQHFWCKPKGIEISFGSVVCVLKNCVLPAFQFLTRQAAKVCQITGSFFSSHSSEKDS